MAIGMGECREKVRAQMVEVSSTSEGERCFACMLTGGIENDTTSWETAGGTRLSAGWELDLGVRGKGECFCWDGHKESTVGATQNAAL
jgi:hypothetical protein